MSLARRSLQTVALVCTLLIGVTSMAVVVSQTAWFKEWLRAFIVRQAEDYVNGRLSIGRLDGNLFFGVELEDIDVTMNGKTVVHVKDAGIDYSALTLLTGHLVLDHIRLNEPAINVEHTPQGWNITQLIKARTPDPDAPKRRLPLEIGEIGVSGGTLVIEDRPVGTSGVAGAPSVSAGITPPDRIARLDASLGVLSDENQMTIDIAHVSFRTFDPGIGVNALSGVIRRTANDVTLENVALRTEEGSLRIGGTIHNIEGASKTVDLKASSDKLALGEFASLVPALERYRDLQPAFEVTATGSMDRMAVDLNAREKNVGDVIAHLMVDAAGPDRRVKGTVAMEHFNAEPIVRTAAVKSDVTGTAAIDLALPSDRFPLSGTYALDASRARIAGYEMRDVHAKGRIDGGTIGINARAAGYGGRATAAGTIETGANAAVDLTGRADHVDLRNLPPSLRIPGAASNLQFQYTLTGRGRVFSGDLSFAPSTLAGARIAGGTVAQFTLGAGAPAYAAKGEVANLDAYAIGRAFGIPTLAADRFRGSLNATFDVKGSGGGPYPLILDASGQLVDSQMFGASIPRLDFATSLSRGDATVRATGEFMGLDPAIITGKPELKGELAGAVDATTTIRDYARGLGVDSVDASGRVNLASSRIGELTIDTAVVDGTYANRAGSFNQIAIDGPDFRLQGRGPVALDDTGASNFAFHAESPSLDRVGRLLAVPLKGSAIVDATMTGNAGELTTKGSLTGSNVGYGESEALSLTSDFAVTVPNLTPEAATIQAKTMATFLDIAGQKVNALTADTTYRQHQLDFDATAQEGVRRLTAAGSALFHPDHHEVHVRNVALQAEQIRWESEPGAEARIQYATDRLAVENVRLSSGDQHIVANGVVGSTTEPLRVQAENVDVAQLDQLLLGDQRLAGRLTANATVTGSTSDPRVAGDFTLAQGAFRAFKFESLAGKVDYGRDQVSLDVRLQQSSAAWLTAKGHAPVTLFRPNPTDMEDVHETPAPGQSVDIQIASSPVDFGLIQGFTGYVTNVTGVMQANLTVTGSGHDPHLDGTLDIKGGAFGIPALGTEYTGLDTQIQFKPDAVSVSQMRVVDKHKNVLTIGGTLAVHERSVGAVDIKMQSQDFEAIDNEFATNLRVDTDLRLTGTIRAPKVEGYIESESGSINVQAVLERATASPYATEAASLEPQQPKPLTAEAPDLLGALDLNVGLAIPSNLIIRGTNLRPANAPIDIGDISVTVGGAIQVRKAPGEKIRIAGEVNTVRGSYTFQGRRFDILRDGRIRFGGTEELDPVIDLRARREIAGVETFVRVRGTMGQPELTFSSNPPLDEADILSLIVFNVPVSELGEGQQVSLAERAGALAGSYLTSGLTRSIGSALELDEFELQAIGQTGTTPTLLIGEQVGSRTFFRIRQGFGAEQATEFILEYQIADFLRLQGAVAETSGGTQRVTFRRVERGGIDLIFFFSY